MRVGGQSSQSQERLQPQTWVWQQLGSYPCRDGCQPCFLGEKPHCFFTTSAVLTDSVTVAGALAAAVAVAVAVAAAAALLVEWGRSLLHLYLSANFQNHVFFM